MTISRLVDKAILLLKKEKEKDLLEYQQKMAKMYPNREIKIGHNASKTQNGAELLTKIREIRKAMKTGELGTTAKYSADNVRKMFES